MPADKLKKRKGAPNTFVIMSSILVLVAVLTWVIPAGSYDRETRENREVVVAGTFHEVEPNPQNVMDVLTAPIDGFVAAALIIGFVLIVGGAFGILQKTGAVDAGIGAVVDLNRRSRRAELLTIPVIMLLFSFGGATFGMSEEIIPFIGILVPLALSLGYDSMVGVAIPFLGAGAGFAGAFLNPFTVGVAQGIAELPPSSGMGYRIVCWFLITFVAIFFTMRYGARVRRDPTISPVYDLDLKKKKSLSDHKDQTGHAMTRAHTLILCLFLVALAALVVGVKFFGWYIAEICALFLALGLLAGAIGGLTVNTMTEGFIDGAKDLLGTAFIIGLARGILVVATDGRIIDTVLKGLSSTISGFHPIVSSQVMFVIQSLLNFFVPSGSGQAALTMPVMAPLSDLLGVSRQTAVLAFQFGDGFSNMIIPTSAVCMGVLAMAKIPWEKWARWVLPLQVIFLVLGFLLLIPPFFLQW